MKTRVTKVPTSHELGHWADHRDDASSDLETWELPASLNEALASLREAGELLRTSDVPVGFPTETVYGLGADATRSAAVKGIYIAKGRPSDNPLIVHFCDLAMLRRFLSPVQDAETRGINGSSTGTTNGTNGHHGEEEEEDPIPAIYKPLIQRFWPGPLTILLRNPQPSRLAPEVTAGLGTFGCRMPASLLARTLIQLAGAPLAAPSANASTKPSPTAAGHVLDDLDGRIELILDGGACNVGVESTVVDGLCSPPVVLRPGGVSLDELRACPGWEGVEKAYKDQAEEGKKSAPRAPGMKYKHYSPRAKVVLYEASYEAGKKGVLAGDLDTALEGLKTKESLPTVGVIRTRGWSAGASIPHHAVKEISYETGGPPEVNGHEDSIFNMHEGELLDRQSGARIGRLLDVDLGQDNRSVARGLFSALRELDRHGADVIFVEGVSDGEDITAAIMNRLRKAASEIRV